MKNLFIILSLLVVPAIALANGSPINVSEVFGVGNITMMKNNDITLEEEYLHVEIDGDYANVSVEYKLKNNGPDVTVPYGFPLDSITNEYEDEESSEEQFTDLKMQDDSGALKVSIHADPLIETSKRTIMEGLAELKIERKWYVTELIFKTGELKTLKIYYRLMNRLDDWVYSKSFQPRFSDRKFQYILQPSKNWGNGKVKKFSAVIDLNNLLKIDGVVKEINPKGHQCKNGLIIWKADNFDLNNAKDIQVVYDNAASQMTKYISEYRMPTKLIINSSASSVLPTGGINKYRYGPDNLFDNDYNTAWVEGAQGHGIGEWVELDLDMVSIEGIGIINGYTKRNSLYYANNRIKKLRLDVEWENWGSKENVGKETTELSLKQKEFNELNRNAHAPFISWLADYGDGYNRAQKVRLTILDVYPGTKYDDTPITELFILGNKFED